MCFLDQESEVYSYKDESLGLGMELSGRIFAHHVQCPQHHKEEEGKKKRKGCCHLASNNIGIVILEAMGEPSDTASV